MSKHTITLSKAAIAAAPYLSVLVIVPDYCDPRATAHPTTWDDAPMAWSTRIIHRQADDGIVDDELRGAEILFPMSMVQEGNDYLEPGDWNVIPYIRGANWDESLYRGIYTSFEVRWTD